MGMEAGVRRKEVGMEAGVRVINEPHTFTYPHERRNLGTCRVQH